MQHHQSRRAIKEGDKGPWGQQLLHSLFGRSISAGPHMHPAAPLVPCLLKKVPPPRRCVVQMAEARRVRGMHPLTSTTNNGNVHKGREGRRAHQQDDLVPPASPVVIVVTAAAPHTRTLTHD